MVARGTAPRRLARAAQLRAGPLGECDDLQLERLHTSLVRRDQYRAAVDRFQRNPASPQPDSLNRLHGALADGPPALFGVTADLLGESIRRLENRGIGIRQLYIVHDVLREEGLFVQRLLVSLVRAMPAPMTASRHDKRSQGLIAAISRP